MPSTGTRRLCLAASSGSRGGELRGIYRIVFTTEFPAGNIEARSDLDAGGGCEYSEFPLDVGSGGLVDDLGDSLRGESGDLLRYLLSGACQTRRAGKRDQLGNMGLVTWI